jgi:hypothetical protein
MARYGYHSYEVGGMQMGHLPRRSPMGMDPNDRGGVYRGQRLREQADHAAYGRYRAEHARDLDAHGGPRGRHVGAGMLRDLGPTRPSGPEFPPGPRSPERYRGRPTGESVPSHLIRGSTHGYGRYQRRYGDDYSWRPFDRGDRGRSGRSGEPGSGFRHRAGARGRYDMFDASRPLRYDRGFEGYSGFRGGGFSEGYLGSGF